MEKSKLKILIVGHGRSGKDEAAQFMQEHLGFRYGGSTSWAALPLMAEHLGLHPMHAWEQRHALRQLWRNQCDVFRKQDPCLLIRRALSNDANVITGVRGLPEIDAAIAEGLFTHIVWINRPGTPVDPTLDFGSERANVVILNDGTLEEFHYQLTNWALTVAPITYNKYVNRLLDTYGAN